METNLQINKAKQEQNTEKMKPKQASCKSDLILKQTSSCKDIKNRHLSIMCLHDQHIHFSHMISGRFGAEEGQWLSYSICQHPSMRRSHPRQSVHLGATGSSYEVSSSPHGNLFHATTWQWVGLCLTVHVCSCADKPCGISHHWITSNSTVPSDLWESTVTVLT